MKKKENCYFWIDSELPEEERKINALCEKCHNEKFQNKGWFWEGSKRGYGPFDFICSECSHVIHSHQKDQDEKK
jgi:hypothetical protein